MSIPLEAFILYDSLPVENNDFNRDSAPRAAEDAALVQRANNGDAQAFEELVRRYRNAVFALSYHFVRNREEAWDISQEVFVKAYRSLKWFRGESSFKTWILRIAANHCKDQLKRRRLDTVSFDDAIRTDAPSALPDPGTSLLASELGAAIETAVATLSAKHRTAFVLREYEGMSYQEMAEVMHCSLGTVMSRLHHARRKLQNVLIRMGVVEDS
jgi:RNA polymerase sigma-70 factor (ECF subfamily)